MALAGNGEKSAGTVGNRHQSKYVKKVLISWQTQEFLAPWICFKLFRNRFINLFIPQPHFLVFQATSAGFPSTNTRRVETAFKNLFLISNLSFPRGYHPGPGTPNAHPFLRYCLWNL